MTPYNSEDVFVDVATIPEEDIRFDALLLEERAVTAALRKALADVREGYDTPTWPKHRIDDLVSSTRKQFRDSRVKL